MERQWLNLSAAEYHALDALGSSAIKCFAVDGQLEFYARYIAKTKERKETDAMRLGRAFHAAMEDENGWEKRYARIPTSIEDDEFVEAINGARDPKSKAEPLVVGVPIYPKFPTHREYVEAHRLRAERLGLDWMNDDEIEIVHRQIQSAYANPAIRELLENKSQLNVEATCIAQHSSGLKIKALCDMVLPAGIIDFKTTSQPNNRSFLWDAFKKRHYDYQAGLYRLVTGKERFWFISIKGEPEYEANLFEVPPRLLEQRQADIDNSLNLIAQTMRMSALDEKDESGIPPSWHSEGWGTCMSFDLEGPFATEIAA